MIRPDFITAHGNGWYLFPNYYDCLTLLWTSLPFTIVYIPNSNGNGNNDHTRHTIPALSRGCQYPRATVCGLE